MGHFTDQNFGHSSDGFSTDGMIMRRGWQRRIHYIIGRWVYGCISIRTIMCMAQAEIWYIPIIGHSCRRDPRTATRRNMMHTTT